LTVPAIQNIYVYKMTTDNGGAPCVHRGLLSLSICKPMIRRCASVGDLVFGFGGRALRERLIYAAVITGKLVDGSYYWNRQFSRRPDRIYERAHDGRAMRRPDARFHTTSDELEHDVGLGFERAQVLLSMDFRYFGKNGTTEYARAHADVAALIRGLGRGHRVGFSPGVRTELLALKDELWNRFTEMKNGVPTQQDRSRRCNTESSQAVIPA
jgi:hypothetical protein